MADIIRGTTPTITFKYSAVSVSDIAVAYLTIRQGNARVEKDIESAMVDAEENTLSWTLAQDDTLALAASATKATAICDWKLASGIRGRSSIASFTVGETGKDEVI